MINNVVLVGRLTRDPELRKTQSGVSVVNFTLAVNRTFTDQSGERQADFINCVVWRNQADNLARYMRQGSLIGVEGRIQTSSFESEQGTRYVTEVLADGFNGIEFLSTGNNAGGSNSGTNNNQGGFDEDFGAPIDDGDMPF